MLLRPTVDRDRTAGRVVVLDLDETPDDKRFTDDHKELADSLLDLPGQVRTLSSLLHEAADFDNDLPALIALRAINAYNPAISAAMLKNKSHVLVAVPANRLIESPGGAAGDELLLTTAEIVVPAEDQNTVHEESA
jgi:hypothetical protein